ncbi:hypothetical protein CIG75_19110 [Tumebacillus algifaecis]|uniref:SprT-like domain-containing protein n=1 Tax=Tumebacillus algifaecis TaxID=1214604 RepID=A0A223D5U9_9BACL|nr:hypothetical protein [Tumebacillus algifaecis]ASS76843.1 hypothetical protein CIG75_19110 [Tumebacillus algifaecis]
MEQLKKAANELSQKHWGVDYTGEIELTNAKWKNRQACYLIWPNAPEKTVVIQMSHYVNRTLTRYEVLDNLLHELVHWQLHQSGKKFHDDDQEFVDECLRVGAPISGTKKAGMAARKWAEQQWGKKLYERGETG